MDKAAPSIVYRYQNGLYVNLTNRCPTACVFCVKNSWKMDYRGSNLDLSGAEPSPAEVIALAKAEMEKAPFSELVFCGYGEPTMRLEALLACARLVRSGRAAPLPRDLRIRVNTNGLANAVWGRNVVPELAGLVDSVHVSLNSHDPARWLELMRPAPPYAANGFSKVQEFLREAAALLPEAVATAIEDPSFDEAQFRALAAALGAKVRLRPRLETEGGA